MRRWQMFRLRLASWLIRGYLRNVEVWLGERGIVLEHRVPKEQYGTDTKWPLLPRLLSVLVVEATNQDAGRREAEIVAHEQIVDGYRRGLETLQDTVEDLYSAAFPFLPPEQQRTWVSRLGRPVPSWLHKEEGPIDVTTLDPLKGQI